MTWGSNKNNPSNVRPSAGSDLLLELWDGLFFLALRLGAFSGKGTPRGPSSGPDFDTFLSKSLDPLGGFGRPVSQMEPSLTPMDGQMVGAIEPKL